MPHMFTQAEHFQRVSLLNFPVVIDWRKMSPTSVPIRLVVELKPSKQSLTSSNVGRALEHVAAQTPRRPLFLAFSLPHSSRGRDCVRRKYPVVLRRNPKETVGGREL